MAPLLSGSVADDPWIAVPVVVLLTLASFAAVQFAARTRVSVFAITAATCGVVLSLLIFTAWGILLNAYIPSFVKSLPIPMRIGSLFVYAPITAMIVAGIFCYPLAILFPRRFLWVLLLAATFVFLVQFWPGRSSQSVGANLSTYVFACVALLLPFLVWIAVKRIIRHLAATAPRDQMRS